MLLLWSSWIPLMLIGVLTVLIANYLIGFVKKLWLLPPGPWGLPIVGYVPWIGQEAYVTFTQLGKKYGGLFSVQLGGDTVVVLNDWPTIKATLVDEPKIFSGRPRLFLPDAAAQRKDIAFSDGNRWHKQRKLTIQCLRNIGMGKKSTESIIAEIVHQLLDTFTKMDGQIVAMKSRFFEPIMRINWGMVSGDTVSGTDVTVEQLERSLREVLKGFSSSNPLGIFPWLRFVPPNGFGFYSYIRASDQLKNMVKKVIREHALNWNEGSEMDIIDHYLTAIKRNKTENQKEDPPFDVEHLTGTIWDLFMAGSDTTNNSCQWAFLYIGCHPEEQQKVQEELDSVVGRDRMINVSDFPNLPYLDAFIKEVHRLSSILPLSVPHSPIKDFHIRGYTIPKGTVCLQNIYAVHHDPKLWHEPEVFRPERFLDNNNKSSSPPFLMPFSLGSRMCLGQSVAEMELKLIVGGLLQRLTFTLPQDRPRPSFQPDIRIVICPKPYSLHVKLRK